MRYRTLLAVAAFPVLSLLASCTRSQTLDVGSAREGSGSRDVESGKQSPEAATPRVGDTTRSVATNGVEAKAAPKREAAPPVSAALEPSPGLTAPSASRAPAETDALAAKAAGETSSAGAGEPKVKAIEDAASDSESAPPATVRSADAAGSSPAPKTGTERNPASTGEARSDPSPVTGGPSAVGDAKNFVTHPPAEVAKETLLPPKAADLYAELRALRERIPILFLDLDRSANEIDRDVKQAIESGERFLSEYGDSTQAAWVRATLGRDYIIRAARFQNDVKKEVTEQTKGLPPHEASEEIDRVVRAEVQAYVARIRKLAEEALAVAPKGSETRQLALMLLADVAEKEGFWEGSIQASRQVLAEFPDCRYRPKIITDVGKILLYGLGHFDEAAKWATEASEKYRDDVEWVDYMKLRYEALEALGDLEGMLPVLATIQREYPARAESTSRPYYALQYKQEWATSGFWIGFVRYALGDIPGARLAFEECVATIDAWQTQLTAQGKNLPPVPQIFRDLRAKDILYFLDEYQGKDPRVGETCVGKAASVDLVSGVEWVTGAPITFPAARGKVFAVLFRRQADRRSQSTVEEVAGIVRGRSNVAGAMLAPLQSVLSADEKMQRREALRAEMTELGVELPAGFDTTPNSCIFRSLHATVGTASFIVYDKNGRPVWYLFDPRPLDRALIRRVLERLASES